jgi:hypothetical protein
MFVKEHNMTLSEWVMRELVLEARLNAAGLDGEDSLNSIGALMDYCKEHKIPYKTFVRNGIVEAFYMCDPAFVKNPAKLKGLRAAVHDTTWDFVTPSSGYEKVGYLYVFFDLVLLNVYMD